MKAGGIAVADMQALVAYLNAQGGAHDFTWCRFFSMTPRMPHFFGERVRVVQVAAMHAQVGRAVEVFGHRHSQHYGRSRLRGRIGMLDHRLQHLSCRDRRFSGQIALADHHLLQFGHLT